MTTRSRLINVFGWSVPAAIFTFIASSYVWSIRPQWYTGPDATGFAHARSDDSVATVTTIVLVALLAALVVTVACTRRAWVPAAVCAVMIATLVVGGIATSRM